MPYDQEERGKKPEKTLASIKNKYQSNIRREYLQQIFKSIRQQVQQSFRQKQQQTFIYPPMCQPLFQPFTPAYLQYIQEYLARCGAPQFFQNNLPLPLPPGPAKQPQIITSIKPPIEDDIYFQKENFRIYKRLIGEGTFSKVWEGVNLVTNEKIAAKQIKKLQDHESKCLKTLTSPFIVKIYTILKHKGSSFIILEYCQRNLRQQLDKCNYDLGIVLRFFEQMLEGMDVLQSRNFIHRDLKFENILISNGTVKIADFGLAKCIGDQLEVESRRCGTPYTMAPQIYFSRDYKTPYSVKCDIWSLGVILHQMLYQKHPFGFNQSDFKRKKRVSIKKRFGILDELIQKCLIFRPEKRICWDQVISIYQQYLKAKDRFMDIENFPIQTESIIYRDPKQGEKEKKQQFQKMIKEAKKQQEERRIKYLHDYNASVVPKQISSKMESKEERSAFLEDLTEKKNKESSKQLYMKQIRVNKPLYSRDQILIHRNHEINSFHNNILKENKKQLFINHRRRIQKESQFSDQNNMIKERGEQKPEKNRTEIQTVKRQVYFLQSPKRQEIKRRRIMGEMAIMFLSIIFICIFICF